MRLLIIGFVIAALLTLFPFGTEHTYFMNAPSNLAPVGELVSGTRAVQKGHFPPIAIPADVHRHLCVGIQFATYVRRNQGELNVAWRQPGHEGHWSVDSSKLEDNQYAYFCPKGGIDLDSDFEIALTSTKGESGHAPTAWLTDDTRFGNASVNGEEQSKSLSLSFATHREITPIRISRLDHHAYFFGWLLSLTIGLVALLAARRTNTV